MSRHTVQIQSINQDIIDLNHKKRQIRLLSRENDCRRVTADEAILR